MGSSDVFTVDEAQIVGLFMESVFYGIYLITFAACIKTLLWADTSFRPANMINWKMVVAALGMLVFATMDVGFGLHHNLQAFVTFKNPDVVFADTSNWVNVMKMVNYVAQTFIGDSILIYRCFIVFNRNWVIVILPILLWLAESACGVMTIYIEATMNDSGGLNSRQLIPFISSMLSLTLATNLLTTGLIVYRIWTIQSIVKDRTGANAPLQSLIRILIESGLLYTLTIVILFCTYITSNNAQLGVSDSVVQIIGITFNLIITSVDRPPDVIPSRGTTVTGPSGPTSPTNSRYMVNIERTVVRQTTADDIEAKAHSLNSLNDSMQMQPYPQYRY